MNDQNNYRATLGEWALVTLAFALLLFGAPAIEWLVGGLL